MTRRIATLLAVLALALSMLVGVGSAENHHDMPEHGDIRVLHAQWTGPGVGPGTVVLS